MMKLYLFVLLTLFSSASLFAQIKKENTSIPDSTKKIEVVETACGQCKFSLPGKSCDLAVRINGKAYFVDGTSIDEHGDAHAEDGFCNAIRKAKVQGVVTNDRFKVSYFKLVKE